MMNVIKKCGLPLVVILVLLGLLNWTHGLKQKPSDQIRIGILQYMEHPSLDLAREGFIEGLKEEGYIDGQNISIMYKNAQGEQANLKTLSQQLTTSNDLVLGIATPAAQSLAANTEKTPVLFTAVTDPIDAKLVQSLEKPGGLLTGTSDGAPIEKQIDLMGQVLSRAKKIGILYTTSEANSVVTKKKARAYLEKKGYQVVEKGVATSNDVQSAAESLLSEVDAAYVPTDNTLSTTLPTLKEASLKYQTPFFGGSTDMVDGGVLFTYGTNYRELGKQTARHMAVQVLKGKKVAQIPVELAEQRVVRVNQEVADALRINTESLKD